MLDFLLFKRFLSIPVLIGFYYMGAIIMPLFVWITMQWLLRRSEVVDQALSVSKLWMKQGLSTQQKIILIFLFIFSMLFLELLWRIMFEYLIAYMQMRDALVL